MDLDAAIVKLLPDVEPLAVVVGFGSRVCGSPRPDSDLDVAILPKRADPDERRRLQSRLAAALAELAPGGRVDVVILDEAPELLRQRILETGRVLLNQDPSRWQQLRVQTMREHGDREPYRRLLRQAQQQRLLQRK